MGVGEICSRDVVFARRNESVAQAARLMREHRVGSVVVIDGSGGLVGVNSADDVLEVLAEELYGLGAMMTRGERREIEERRKAA